MQLPLRKTFGTYPAISSSRAADRPRGRTPKPAPHGSGVPSISRYAKNRARILQWIFTGVERRVMRGVPVRRSIRAAARRWKGQYRDGHKIKFSEPRLGSLFYRWRREGETALVLRYYHRKCALSPKSLVLLVRRCGDPGILSMSAAVSLRQAKKVRRCSVHQFYRALDSEQRLLIRSYHKAKAQADAARRQFDELLHSLTVCK
jgi:hypothetical protein